MLIFHFKKIWFDKIKAGEKDRSEKIIYAKVKSIDVVDGKKYRFKS